MAFSRRSLTLCRSARMLSTVGGSLRRCSSRASFKMRNNFVLTLKPTISGVRPSGWGMIPADVICSSSTSLGSRRACMISRRRNNLVDMLTAASSRRRLIVRARYIVRIPTWGCVRCDKPSMQYFCPLETVAESQHCKGYLVGRVTCPVDSSSHLTLDRVKPIVALIVSSGSLSRGRTDRFLIQPHRQCKLVRHGSRKDMGGIVA